MECGEKPASDPSVTQVLLSAGNGGSLEIRLTEPAESLLLLPFQVKDGVEPGFLLTMGILLAIAVSAVIVLSVMRVIDLEERCKAGDRARYLLSLGPASIEKSWAVWYSAAVGVGVTAALPALNELVGAFESPAGLDPLVVMGVVLAIPLAFAPLVLVNQVKNPAPAPSIDSPEGSYLVSISRFLFAQFLVISSALGETVLLAFWVWRSSLRTALLPEFATFLGVGIVAMAILVGIYFAYHRIMTTYRETAWRPTEDPPEFLAEGASLPGRRRMYLV